MNAEKLEWDASIVSLRRDPVMINIYSQIVLVFNGGV